MMMVVVVVEGQGNNMDQRNANQHRKPQSCKISTDETGSIISLSVTAESKWKTKVPGSGRYPSEINKYIYRNADSQPVPKKRHEVSKARICLPWPPIWVTYADGCTCAYASAQRGPVVSVTRGAQLGLGHVGVGLGMRGKGGGPPT